MFTHRLAQIIFASFVLCSGCNSQELNRSKAKALLEAKPVEFEITDIIGLTDEQASCATSAGLVEVRHDADGGQSIITTDLGEKLGLHGRLVSSESSIYVPTDNKELVGKRQINLHGSFNLAVDEISGIRAESGAPTNKIALVEFHVKLPHACFPKPLKVVNGKGPVLNFRFRRYDDGWHVEFQVPFSF